MNNLQNASIWIFVWIACLPCNAQELRKPFAVIFMNGNVDRQLVAELIRARNLKLGDDRLNAESAPNDYGVFDSLVKKYPDFKFVTGNAHFGTDAGKYVTCRFISAPNEGAFDEFVESERSSRGGGSARRVDEGVGNIRIVTPPATVESNGTQFHTEYHDLCFRYVKGLVCYGGEEIFKMDLSEVEDLIPVAAEHHTYWRIVPGNLTAQSRAYYLESQLAGIGIRGQKFDNESSEAYESRRAILSVVEVFLRGTFDDIDEIVVSKRFPFGDSGYQSDCTIKIRQESELARFVGELSASRPQAMNFPASAVINAYANVGLTKELIAFVRAHVSRFPNASPVKDAFLPLVDEGTLSLQASVSLDEKNHPLLQLSTPVSIDSLSSVDMALALRSAFELSPEGNSVLPFIHSTQLAFLKHYRLTSRVDDGRMRMLISDPETAVLDGVLKSQSTLKDEEHEIRTTSLLKVEWDFSSCIAAKQESPIRLFLDTLERRYFDINVQNDPAVRMRITRQLARQPANFKPLISIAEGDGDWTGHLSVNADDDGSTVKLDFRAGADLYHLYRAREAMNTEARNAVLGF